MIAYFGVIFHILPNIDVNFSLVNHTLQVTESSVINYDRVKIHKPKEKNETENSELRLTVKVSSHYSAITQPLVGCQLRNTKSQIGKSIQISARNSSNYSTIAHNAFPLLQEATDAET